MAMAPKLFVTLEYFSFLLIFGTETVSAAQGITILLINVLVQ